MMDSPVSATPKTSIYKTWLRVQDFLPPSLCDSLCDDVENGKKLGLSCKNEENTANEEAENETNGREGEMGDSRASIGERLFIAIIEWYSV